MNKQLFKNCIIDINLDKINRNIPVISYAFHIFVFICGNKFKKLILEKRNKKKLSNENILLLQISFNGKYYDIGLLVKADQDKHFYIIIFQITIKKDSDKRFTKLEHELILSAVKKNVENEYDIIIDEAYFYYIFCKYKNQNTDIESINYCIKNKLCYIIYNIDTENFEYVNKNINDALITTTFICHNFISLFQFNKNENKKLYNYLNSNINYKTDFNSLDNKYFIYVKNIFKNKDLDETMNINQFKSCDIKKKFGNISDFSYLYKYTTEYCFIIIRQFIDNIYKIIIQFLGFIYIYDDNLQKFKSDNNIIFENNLEDYLLCYSEYPLEILI